MSIKGVGFWIQEDVGTLRLLCVLPPDRAETYRQALHAAGSASNEHGNKPVIVWAIDREIFDKYETAPGRNGNKSLPVDLHHIFESATEASWHLGCKRNEVAMALSVAKRSGQDEAKVRGITFKYTEDCGRE